MGRKQAHVIFSGLVQGVFFRATTEDIARSMGITGWVKNTMDGQVEAVFEGEETAVRNCISRCKNGPPASRVDNVDVKWGEPEDLQGFSTRYM